MRIRTCSVRAIAACAAVLLLATSALAAPKKTITVWGWTDPVFKTKVEQFEKANPGITVKLTAVGELVSGDEKFLSAIASGIAPDVIIQNRHQFKGMAAGGYYRDLSPFMKREPGFEGQFLKKQLDNCKWLGHLYAVPMATDTRFLYWNKEMFKQAGFDPDQPPKNWRDLETFSRKFQRRNDKGGYSQLGFVPHLGNSWLWMWGWLAGGDFVSRDEKIATPDNPKVIEALEWCVKYYDQVLGINGAMPSSWPSFDQKKLAMIIDGSWSLNYYSSINGLDYGVAQAPYPQGGDPTTWSCGFALCLPKNSKAQNVDAAWKFIKFITGSEGWLIQAEYQYSQNKKNWAAQKRKGDPAFVPELICNIPAVKAIKERFKDRMSNADMSRWDFAFSLLDRAHDCGNMSLAGQLYWNELDKAYWLAVNHKTTPVEALKQCRVAVQAELDKAWKKRVRVRN